MQLLAVDGSVLRDALTHKKIIAKGEEVRADSGGLGGEGDSVNQLCQQLPHHLSGGWHCRDPTGDGPG